MPQEISKYNVLLWAGRPRSSSQCKFTNIHSKSSRPPMGTTQPHIQWVPGVMWHGREVGITHFQLVQRSKRGSIKKKTPWSESTSELYRPSDRRLSAKWLPTFPDGGHHVVSVTDPYGRIFGFLDRSRYFSIKQLLSSTHEAVWTPFQTQYFFFILVVPGMEPGPPDL
jgi:hypothetical protein